MMVNFMAILVYFTAVSNILWPLGIFCGEFVMFFPVLVCCAKKKSGNPALER
jgi:hypothetical protein